MNANTFELYLIEIASVHGRYFISASLPSGHHKYAVGKLSCCSERRCFMIMVMMIKLSTISLTFLCKVDVWSLRLKATYFILLLTTR